MEQKIALQLLGNKIRIDKSPQSLIQCGYKCQKAKHASGIPTKQQDAVTSQLTYYLQKKWGGGSAGKERRERGKR